MDYYEQGSNSVAIDPFTEALLDWLDESKTNINEEKNQNEN